MNTRCRTVPWSLRHAVFERDNYTCQYCGRDDLDVCRYIPSRLYFVDGTLCKRYYNNIKVAMLHADHIIPYNYGGETTLENLTTACSWCNHKKWDYELTDKLLERLRGNVKKPRYYIWSLGYRGELIRLYTAEELAILRNEERSE